MWGIPPESNTVHAIVPWLALVVVLFALGAAS
jgi:hypothetical protein